MQVMLVEDNVDVAWAMSRLLCGLGHDVLSCPTPAAALEAVNVCQPDLVLLDIGLPEIDGYALAKLLRQRGLAKTPIMALSSQADDAVRRRAATINAHYVKPVGMRDIEQIFESVSID